MSRITRRDRMRNEIVREKSQQNGTIVEKIRQRRLWFEHVMRMDDCRRPLRGMYCQVEGIQSRGRRRRMWIDNIKEDLKAYNLDMRTATDFILHYYTTLHKLLSVR